MPKTRQSLLFSATISSSVKEFTLSGIKDYKMLQVDKESKLSDDLKCHFYVIKSLEKTAALLYIMQEMIDLKSDRKEQTIVFCATRHHVEYLHEISRQAGLKTTFIFGLMDQQTREDRLAQFRMKKVNYLIVTDLAARGIDIPYLQNVIHYDFPPSLKLFIHRSGRTARNGQSGTSFSLVTNDELAYMSDITNFVGRKLGEPKHVEDCKYISYGMLPQKTLDEYSEYAEKLHQRNPLMLKGFYDSMKKAMIKYNRTKESASQAGITATRGLELTVHPTFVD